MYGVRGIGGATWWSADDYSGKTTDDNSLYGLAGGLYLGLYGRRNGTIVFIDFNGHFYRVFGLFKNVARYRQRAYNNGRERVIVIVTRHNNIFPTSFRVETWRFGDHTLVHTTIRGLRGVLFGTTGTRHFVHDRRVNGQVTLQLVQRVCGSLIYAFVFDLGGHTYVQRGTTQTRGVFTGKYTNRFLPMFFRGDEFSVTRVVNGDLGRVSIQVRRVRSLG